MTDGASMVRRSVFEGVLRGASRPQMTIAEAPAAARFSVRIAIASQHDLTDVGGFNLSLAINRWSGTPEQFAMRLGPDEWLVVGPQSDGDKLRIALDQALAGRPHAVVDVSHRQAALMLSGSAVADVLNTGCPLDLHEASFPIGSATRTVFHKAEIVLVRIDHAPTFRVEVARSFAPYVAALIGEAALTA